MAFTRLQRCEIGNYAAENGITKACKKFDIPCTTAWHVKSTYEENAKGLLVVSLNRHKRRRPTALGAFIDDNEVCVKIVHAVAKALLLFYNVTIAKENRERAIASKAVSRSIFRKLQKQSTLPTVELCNAVLFIQAAPLMWC